MGIVGLVTFSCVKETYDMNRLSKKMRLNPGLAVSAATGEVTLGDVIKTNDTVFFDDENLLKLWIRKDSVVEISLDSLIDLKEVFSFSESYPIGEVSMADISTQYQMSLNQLSLNFDPALRTQLQTLDDGSPHPFPALPQVNAGTYTLTSYSGFDNVVFASGNLNIRFTNNLGAPVTGMKIQIMNADDNSPVGPQVQIPVVAAGDFYTTFIDLSGKRLYKSVKAVIVFDGSPGTTSPVMIKMSDLLVFEVFGTDLKVSSGRFIVPEQTLTEPGAEEFVSFNPGDGMEITELKLNTGTINYSISSEVDVRATISVTLPSVTRSGVEFSEDFVVNPSSTASGTFSANNLHAMFNANPLQQYNSLPAEYELVISSQGSMIDFSADDLVSFEATIENLGIDYVKGYFGQRTEAIEAETIDLEIDELIDRLDGEFRLVNPVFTLDYSNSFGLPVEITLNATGRKPGSSVNLNLLPFTLGYPVYPVRDKDDSFTIDRNNSSLPELISMPPSSIEFSGSARLNPAGNTGGLRNNYIYGNSRFIAGIEALVPMDLWINNLQFADTVENFMRPEEGDEGFSPEDLDYIRLDLMVTNGFPLGASVSLILRDTVSGADLYLLNVPEVIEPAPVNSNGRVTSGSEKKTQIVLDDEFFEAAKEAHVIILKFTLSTTGSGSQSVKIYSDYKITFKAGLVVRTDFILN